MADWTAVLTAPPTFDGQMVAFTVEFRKDGEDPRIEDFRVDRFSRQWFKGFIREKLDTLNFPHEVAQVTPGPIDVTPETPTIDPARQAYYQDLVLWRRLKTVGEFKPAVLNSQQYTDCVARLRDNFQPSYLDMI